jgi:hypothetical protein
MIDTIATFLSTVVELLQTGITGFVDGIDRMETVM